MTSDQIMQIVHIGFILFFILCMAYTYLALLTAWRLLNARFKAVVKMNDSSAAGKAFAGLLGRAERRMVVYDDGNGGDSSIYNNEDILAKVMDRLEEKKDLRIQFCFNCDEPELLFRKEFRDNPHPRVSIKTLGLDGDSRPDDMHYKIIDDGQMAHLSRHKFGSEERRFKLVDCRARPKFISDFVSQATLGEYLEDFEEKFSRARPAASSA